MLPASQQLISEGININGTLLFGLPRYRQVAEAYIAGIAARAAQGKPVEKVAYQTYKEFFGSDRFRNLANKGAPVQRLLWASTGTKNPQYSDLKYVESLTGPDTVNTVPVETFDAYRDHGEPKARLEEDVEQARWVLERLPELGIDIDRMTTQLEEEGVEKFDKPFDELMQTLQKRIAAAERGRGNLQ